jgi:hypothetical protein
MLQEYLKILKFVIKILTFLMSFKSTLYAFYFQALLKVTKRQESVTKNTGQGEIIIQDLGVTTR